jgi:FkbM family methyltransferase
MSTNASAQLLLKKIRLNLELDRTFLRLRRLSRAERIRYLIDKYRAMAMNSGCVNYLGGPFAYDNRWTPALLQDYPAEVLRIDRFADLSTASTVLDVGANVGHFAATTLAMFPHLRVWSLEPNPEVLPLLRRNSNRSASWEIVPVGVSAIDEQRELHFVSGKSGQGSVYRDNAALGLLGGDPVEVTVELRRVTPELCEELRMPSVFDLIKVDVEGFEREVLAGLGDLRWRFLALETSVERSGRLDLDELRAIVAELWGDGPRIAHVSAITAGSPVRDVMLAWPE